MKTFIFWDITSRSTFKVSVSFGGKYNLHLNDRRIGHAKNKHEGGSKQSLKIEATCSFETSADFQQTTLCCFPEDRKDSSALLLRDENKFTYICVTGFIIQV
jgi:hypothetical protein